MIIEIKNRFTKAIFHEGDYASILEAVNDAARLGKNLHGADLRGADLRGADLRGAYLHGADLRDADLRGAYLWGADLQHADLRGANLQYANLRRANLHGANLQDANLQGAINAELIIAQTRILPEGCIIGWKKLAFHKICKLEIPKHAKRSHAFGRKCRVSEALVLGIFEGDIEVDLGYSIYDNSFEYKKGEIVRPKLTFSDNWQSECESGIHFYITREEAEDN